MLIHVDLDAGALSVRHAEDLASLAVYVTGAGGDGDLARALGGLGSPDGDHVWLDVALLRATAGAGQGPDWHDGYDGMVRYAASKGWTDEAGTAVRAHVVRGDPPA